MYSPIFSGAHWTSAVFLNPCYLFPLYWCIGDFAVPYSFRFVAVMPQPDAGLSFT